MEQRTIMPGWITLEEIKVSYRSTIKAADRPEVKTSKDIAELLRKVWDDDAMELSEHCKIMLLNSSNRVMGIKTMAIGNIWRATVDTKLIFGIALKVPCSKIVLAHNHPSGNPRPSQQDISLTQDLVHVAKIFDMTILDHLIITRDTYFSFADEGLL
jgi:DNA repair protein RadC